MIFIIGAAIGFATGTSWGTIGIMAPIVVQVFNYDQQPILCTIGLAAACSGGVMGDHCSPISDTTIMASAGAHCYHLNHVFTQLPYALTVAGVSFVSFILAGLIQNVVICLIIAAALMIATLLVIRPSWPRSIRASSRRWPRPTSPWPSKALRVPNEKMGDGFAVSHFLLRSLRKKGTAHRAVPFLLKSESLQTC